MFNNKTRMQFKRWMKLKQRRAPFSFFSFHVRCVGRFSKHRKLQSWFYRFVWPEVVQSWMFREEKCSAHYYRSVHVQKWLAQGKKKRKNLTEFEYTSLSRYFILLRREFSQQLQWLVGNSCRNSAKWDGTTFIYRIENCTAWL